MLALVEVGAAPCWAEKTTKKTKLPPWEHVTTDDGIVVHSREIPGRGFPTFRGVGMINANIYQVLGVLRDVKRHKEWMDSSIASYMIEKFDELNYVVYGRTDAPWPVSDRDAVFRSRATVDLKKQRVTVRFWAVRSKRKLPVTGVVRMTKLRGYFRFQALSENKTRLVYVVDADPVGSLHKWIARLATKKLPLNTIKNLRKQCRRTNGWYDKQIKAWKAMKFD